MHRLGPTSPILTLGWLAVPIRDRANLASAKVCWALGYVESADEASR
jgi:hypothetical protein